MPKLTAPLFSLSASKAFKKILTFQKRKSGTVVYGFSKPGAVKPFTPSWKQRNQRGIIGLLTAQWQSFSVAIKAEYETIAKNIGFVGTGYHYWIKLAQMNLYLYHGLAGYWSMNELTGDQAYDYSGQDNHGTLGPTYPSNAPSRTDGLNKKFGNALSFDGNDYVDCGNNVVLDIAGNITIEAWIKPADLGIWNLFVARGRYNTYGYYFQQGPNGDDLSYVSNQFGKAQFVFSNRRLLLNTWFHVVAVRSGTVGKIYINGVDETLSSDSILDPKLSSSHFFLGYYETTPIDSFYGLIDEVRIYNRAFSAGEILKHYQMFRR